MRCFDRLSGERFEARDLHEIRAYLAEALCEGEIAAYEVETDCGRYFGGQVTGGVDYGPTPDEAAHAEVVS